MFTKKGYARRGAPIFVTAYAVAAVMFYIGYLMYEVWDVTGALSEVLNYVMAFWLEGLSFVMPVLLSAVMLALADAKGQKYALLRSAVLVVPTALYTLLSEYINATMQGAVFDEAVLMALLWMLASACVFYAEGVIVYFVIRFISRRLKRCGEVGSCFDFSAPFTAALFTVCAVKFAVMTGLEIYTAANYLISFAGRYRIWEIIYMIGRFLFIFAELFVCHICAFKLKLKLNKLYSESEINT